VRGLRSVSHGRVSSEPEEVSQAEKRHAADTLADMPGHRLLTSPEEVDAYINEERGAWDR
jgi:hypothetical protein